MTDFNLEDFENGLPAPPLLAVRTIAAAGTGEVTGGWSAAGHLNLTAAVTMEQGSQDGSTKPSLTLIV
jgi:hypothetical protein